MSYKPILLSTEAIKLIQKGKKTATIQVLPDLPWYVSAQFGYDDSRDGYIGFIYSYPIYEKNVVGEEICGYFITPRYCIGDTLWVQEPYTYKDIKRDKVTYYLDNPEETDLEDCIWSSALSMPKKYARLFLKVNSISIYYLNLLEYDDLTALGFTIDERAKEDFKILIEEQSKLHSLWNSFLNEFQTNKYGWKSLPQVFVYRFEVCDKPDDFLTETFKIDTEQNYTETYYDERSHETYTAYTCPICGYVKRKVLYSSTTQNKQAVKFSLEEFNDPYPFVQIEVDGKEFHICYDCYQNYFNK